MRSLYIICFLMPLIASKCDDPKLTADEKFILNSNWVMTEVKSGEFESSSPESDYVLSFDKPDFSIFLDVNSCGGAFEFLGNGKLNFSGGYCTEACCDSEFATTGLEQLLNGTTYSYIGELSEFTVFEGEDFVKFNLTAKE